MSDVEVETDEDKLSCCAYTKNEKLNDIDIVKEAIANNRLRFLTYSESIFNLIQKVVLSYKKGFCPVKNIMGSYSLIIF